MFFHSKNRFSEWSPRDARLIWSETCLWSPEFVGGCQMLRSHDMMQTPTVASRWFIDLAISSQSYQNQRNPNPIEDIQKSPLSSKKGNSFVLNELTNADLAFWGVSWLTRRSEIYWRSSSEDFPKTFKPSFFVVSGNKRYFRKLAASKSIKTRCFQSMGIVCAVSSIFNPYPLPSKNLSFTQSYCWLKSCTSW